MTKQIPHGYKQTKLGMIPEDWDVSELGNVANIYDGTHMTPTYTSEGVPFYSVETITNDEWNITKFISEEVFEQESKRVKIEYGDILMTRIGDIGTPKFINWHAKASFYVSLALIKNKNKMSFKYLTQYIQSHNFQNELHKRTIHVAFPKKINLGEINHCNIIKPPLKEQEKIAEILSTWDDVITKQEQLIGEKQVFKKGIMQQVFSQKLRFKDDNGNDYPAWQSKKLSGITNITIGEFVIKTKQNPNGLYPVFNGGVCCTGFYDEFNNEGNKIIISARGANAGYVNFEKRKYWAGNSCYSVDIIDKKLYNINYFHYYIKFNQNKFVDNQQAANIPSVSKKDVQNFRIMLPNFAEQTKIADFLTSVDDEITKQTEVLDQLKLQKQSLMQKLLTGQVRVLT